MRFENNRLLIVLERKKKKKEARPRRRLWPALVTAFGLLIVAGGIWFFHELDFVVGGNYVTADYLASNSREKFGADSLYGYTYGEPVKGLKRSESIELAIDFDVDNSGLESWPEVLQIYQDPQLTQEVSPIYNWNKETGKLTLSPPIYSVGNIGTRGLTTEQVTKYDHGQYELFEKDTGSDWGNIGTLYLAVYRDLETGEALDTPIVRIISLEGEISTIPKISFAVSEDGRASFYWEGVEGAEEYFICTVDYTDESGMESKASSIGVTKETEWIYEAPEFNSYSRTNEAFRYYDMSEEDWYDDYSANYAREHYGITEGVYNEQKAYKNKKFCVIAVNQEGTSMMSNTFFLEDLAPMLPYRTATNTASANGFSSSSYSSIEEVSAYGYVTMCDGYTATRLIDYKTEKARVVSDRFIEIDEDGNYVKGVNVPVLKIPYVMEGTPFEYVASIEDYDSANLEKDITFLEEREEKLRKKAGGIAASAEVTSDEMTGMEEKKLSKAQVREVSDVQITANCALSEYIAMNMLGGAELIDLSVFPEAEDEGLVDDAWREAYYQNPLILGAKGYRLNKKGTALKVTYDDKVSVTAKKQEEIIAQTKKIIDEIITEGMTELEKEIAINQYLCDTIEYDEEALGQAEENKYRYVDEKFRDSFTAYGALIQKKCVCAGYAAAFKLLADEAGLKSVVVTGVLEGSLPHAWNKVQINGKWYVLDVTNNDNEYLVNALLNLPDYAGDKVLTEDRDYVIDVALAKYESNDDRNEYYRINQKFFPYETIMAQLVEELQNTGTAILRTEYDLNDEIFKSITEGIFDKLGEDIDLYGFYWMGVIYLKNLS